jgi:hypothetical protein
MLYFAYGSNMLTMRLQGRVSSSTKVLNASLHGYSIAFHKRSIDGSAKCNILPKFNSVVYGVVFDIEINEKPELDRAEGLGTGYMQERVTVKDKNEHIMKPFTYITLESNIDDSLNPYKWYKTLVVEGAIEHGLPLNYIKKIQEVKAVSDPDRTRAEMNFTIVKRSIDHY